MKDIFRYGLTTVLIASCASAPRPTESLLLPTPKTATARPTDQLYPTNTLNLTSTPVLTEGPVSTPTLLPTVEPTPRGTNEATPNSELFPSQVINLTDWKLTLPVGPNGNPREILQPELDTFQMPPFFETTPQGDGVIFRAPVTGVTTENSDYPRTELREMTQDGAQEASWSSTSGRHTMNIDQAIIGVPDGKQHIIAGQIHGGDDNLLAVRYEGESDGPDELFLESPDGDELVVFDGNYELGKRFTIEFQVENGKTIVYYNGDSMYTFKGDYSGYFKAGAYTQSNCEKEEERGGACAETNVGEVVVYQLNVEHQ